MTFDPRIQVQATLVRRAWLDVAIAPHELPGPLSVRVGLKRTWAQLADDRYACQTLMQVLLDTESAARVVTAETIVEQVVQVQGYADQALADVLELKLPEIQLPYARAQAAALLTQSGYHFITLPFQLSGEAERATKLEQPSPEETSQ